MNLYDAHNHLQDDWLVPHREKVFSSYESIGLHRAVVNGTAESDWPEVAALAAAHPLVLPSYGLHPWDAGNRTPGWLDRLRARLDTDPPAGVGEIGLDRWMTDSARPDDPRLAGLRRAPLEEQTEVFLAQLDIAAAQNRAASVHCLAAFGALLDVLQRSPRPARGFLLHAYSGPAEMVKLFADLGAFFSFNGAFLDDRHAAKQAVFKLVPADRLLVETDAPAMPPPQAWRTHKLPPAPDGTPLNHPGNIEAAYAGLASLRGVAVGQLADQVEANFHRLFLASSPLPPG